MIHKSPWLAKTMEEKEDFWGEIESAQNQEIPSVMISGQTQTMTNQQQMYGNQQQMIMLQQPSSAPKVIGILVIIYGAISVLSGVVGVFGGALLANIEGQLGSDGTSSITTILYSLIELAFGAGFIYCGAQISNRRRIGIQIAWILIAITLFIGIIQSLLFSSDLGVEGADSALVNGLFIGGQVVCNTICAILVAIPLMVNNSMMDDSSLWG